jgi:hypothetical protein
MLLAKAFIIPSTLGIGAKRRKLTAPPQAAKTALKSPCGAQRVHHHVDCDWREKPDEILALATKIFGNFVGCSSLGVA